MTDLVHIAMEVNGRQVAVNVEPRRLLADVLRQDLELFATHLGCEHGVCGACTVLVDGRSVRSCCMLAVQADNHRIRTAESLADGEDLHPIQRAFHEEHALQCGFCTPGFMMSTVELLEREGEPNEATIRDYLSGNVCRCTGYVGIVRAVQRAARVLAEETAPRS